MGVENVESGVLANGVRYGFYRVDTGSSAICIAARAGSVFDPPGKHGLAHLVEHLLFKGNEYLRAGELDRAVELSGGEINAYTAREVMIICAEFIPESIEVVAEKLFYAISGVKINEDEFISEKNVVEAEVRGYLSSPEARIYRLAQKSVWGNTPLGRPIEGTPETLSRIGVEDAVRFKASAFSPENISVSIVGRASRECVRTVLSFFEKLESRGSKPRLPPHTEPSPSKIVEHIGVEAGYAAVSMPLPPRDSLVKALPRLRGVIFNLETGATSILFKMLREERGLAYAFNVDVHITSLGSTMSVVVLEGDRSRIDEIVESINNAIDFALKGGYSEREWVYGRRRLYRFLTRREAVSNSERGETLASTLLFHETPFTLEDLVRATLDSKWEYARLSVEPRGVAIIT